MKRSVFLSLALASLTFASCSQEQPAAEATTDSAMETAADSTATTNALAYTCPMHPEVVSNQPGKCPKCQMDLEMKK